MSRLLSVLTLLLLSQPRLMAAERVSFRNDVMAVLSKAGCNMGTCHGNANGKGGFKLSLRGEDPEADFGTLSRAESNRRVNTLEPYKSLLILKPTMQVPHEGGRRFTRGSAEYGILHDWIASGANPDRPDNRRLIRLDVRPRSQILAMPNNSLQITATATWSDGSRGDVTRLAVFEPSAPIVEVSREGIVRSLEFGETTVGVRFLNHQAGVRLAFIPQRPDFEWNGPAPANFVDEHVFSKLQSLRMNPSPVCDDTTFVRRVFLDLLGILPTADEARRFVQSRSTNKREQLIDTLLQRPEFADWWALKWADLLRVEEKTLDRKGAENFYAWIRAGIAGDKPMDQFVRELIAARGSTYLNPPTNFYRAMRNPTARSEAAAQLFLGVRLQCAKCHNHPFDRWTQDDYYGWASLFARVNYKIVDNQRRDRFDKHQFIGEQIVFMDDEGAVKHPATGRPAPPAFLGALADVDDSHGDRLQQLADWMTTADNERFVHTMVNRIWSQLITRGIVDPVDDFRATNPPSNSELLNSLADDFVANGFQLRHLVRVIVNSRTYQLDSTPNATNADDETNFSRAHVVRLNAEQLVDSISQVCGLPVAFSGYPADLRAGQLAGVTGGESRYSAVLAGDRFVGLFGKPQRLQTCSCERSNETTLGQTFEMVSGEVLHNLLSTRRNRLASLLESDRTNEQVVTQFFWTSLSRAPSETELSVGVTHLQSHADRRNALEDIAWAVMNSHEFLLRR